MTKHIVAAMAAVFCTALSLLAADLTVDTGQTVTISEDATYDTVTVYGTLSVARSAKLTAGDLLMKPKGALKLNGSTTSFSSVNVNGDGYIIDESEGSYTHATVNVTGDTDSKMTQLGTAYTILKKSGAGTLTLSPRSAMHSLSVSGGKVIVQSRAVTGYRWYKFTVRDCRSSASTATQMDELYWFDGGGNDLSDQRFYPIGNTFGYQLYDRSADTKWFQNGSKSEWFVNTVFPGVRPIRSYMYWTANDESVRDPSAWRIQASIDGVSYWDNIADVSNFVATTTRNTAAATTNFLISAPTTVTIPTVTLNAGTSLEVSGDTTLSTTGFTSSDFNTPAFCSLSIMNGGVFAWNPSADKTLACLGLDGGGTFKKEGSQNVTIYGDTSFTGGIHVAGGTLTMRTAYRESRRFFKFVFEKSNTTKLQFSELALYDANGGRVNLSANINYSSGSWQGEKLFDGNESTGIYHDNNFPSTPGQVSFELKEGVADYVAAYRFCQSSGNGGWTDAMPREWKVYARPDTSSEWELIDSRSGIVPSYPSDANMWKFYNGGVPFTFTNKVDGLAAIAPSCKVKIDGGATLDVSGTATTLANLAIDCSAATDATLVGGELAAVGEIAFENVSFQDGGTCSVPLAFVGTDGLSRMADWTVVVNGKVSRSCYLSVVGGRLTLCKKGLVLIVK